MSYSFSVRAASASLALAAVGEKLDEVVASQPVHEADREKALGAAEAFLALVPEKEGHDYSVSVNGSVISGDGVLTQASVGVNVSLLHRATFDGTA